MANNWNHGDCRPEQFRRIPHGRIGDVSQLVASTWWWQSLCSNDIAEGDWIPKGLSHVSHPGSGVCLQSLSADSYYSIFSRANGPSISNLHLPSRRSFPFLDG